MFRKTERNYLRRVKTWPKRRYATITEYHNERVLRETWWFLFIPMYSRERIKATNV